MRSVGHECRRRWWMIGTLSMLVATLLAAVPATAAPGGGEQVSVDIAAGAPDIVRTERGHRLSVADFGYLRVPGKPELPSRIFPVAIPPGATLTEVRFDLGEGIVLSGTYEVAPAALPRVLGQEDPAIYALDLAEYEANHAAVYGRDATYPQQAVEFVRTAGYRKYNLVDVRVTPTAYNPATGQLTHYPNITVHVGYEWPERAAPPMIENLARPERFASELVYNYAEAQNWYPREAATGSGLHNFVIITLDSLTSAVAPLAEWETVKGRTVEVVTTSWISSNYMGYDLAEKMRNFLREKYPALQWGVEDVLLVGHYDDVPMRRISQDLGYGQPETDFYYAELSQPDSASWDSDGDHQYGESGDSPEFYAEVNVGRIPWSDAETVLHICEKSVAYEQNEDPTFKENILLLGAYYWSDTDNAELMEAKVDQPWMADWSKTRMYEQNYTYTSDYECDYALNHENVMAVWPEGHYAFVNYAGHGSPTACFIAGGGAPQFISSSDCPALNDDYPAIMFAAACSNSDTDSLNIGQAMMQQGAVGFLGATKVAYGDHGWSDPYDGNTASMDYFFTTRVTSGDYTQGAAHQWALAEMYTHGLWDDQTYEACEWGALWGNPNLSMGPPPFMRVLLVDEAPQYIDPGVVTSLQVRIFEGSEDLTPGSALLHYRYDGGDWETAPLVSLGGELYRADLPAPICTDTPEYYFTAEGSLSGVVACPPNAPSQVLSAEVATVTVIVDENFDADGGWTVEDIDVFSGSWERGIPAGDGSRGDPLSDYDGSGWCYLTENGLGNTDVDGGPTRLISPVFDLSGTMDPVLEYARWWVTDDLDEDPLDVHVSYDNGQSWTWLERAVLQPAGWVKREFRLAHYQTPTSEMLVRFSVMDNPNNSIDEGGIDAVRIYDVACHMGDAGDLNCDAAVNSFDIDPFVLALTDPAGYASAYPDCSRLLADCNGDGVVNSFDIDPFVDLIIGD